MLAQISLTPTESKKLIAKAVAQMERVKEALKEGLVVLHPSSTYFILEELGGGKPRSNVWVCGVIVPKGACVEMAAAGRERRPPDSFPHSWVFDRGKPTYGITLGELFERMGPRDVYIKGGNALDPQGNAGVLAGNPVMEGGTIGRVLAAARRKGFTVIVTVGLEKLIPIPIKEAALVARRKSYEYSMGIPCSLVPCDGGITVTELTAIMELSGAEAIPIASGGLGGAEGSVTLVIRGEREQVLKAIEFAEQVKGATLPQVRTSNCFQCGATISGLCSFPLGEKPWVTM
jgi:hypothetical protein